MLALRRWLDDGGVAGLLADRTLPGQSQRSQAMLPFLGAPALFSDGPFRLAAMLRRRSSSWPASTAAAHRYELRFVELADFGALPPRPRRASARRRDPRALERYVATLEALCREAPYNWFNFFDFWADADASARSTAAAPCGLAVAAQRRGLRRRRRSASRAPPWRSAAPAAFDLGALTALLARVKSGEATFVEKRRVEMLDRTLESRGRLSFQAPDTFVRETLKPRTRGSPSPATR